MYLNRKHEHYTSEITALRNTTDTDRHIFGAQQTSSPQDAQRPAASSPAGPKHQDTEVWESEPAVVTSGAVNTAPPSDAIVWFDGKNLMSGYRPRTSRRPDGVSPTASGP